jgi:cytochrome b6-f complex subunit 4
MPEEKITPDEASVPFYPDHLRTIAQVSGGLVIVLLAVGALGLIFPLGLGDPADPLDTPAHIKPEWYFLALYQLLKFIPKAVGAVIPLIIIAVLALLPFIDRQPDLSPRARRARIALTVLIFILAIGLTIWGEAS